MPRTTKRIEERKYGCNKKAQSLTTQQKLFVAEMVADPTMSPQNAAINAGYKPNSAKVTAQKLLNNPVIAQMIGKAIKDRMDRVEITQDDVLKFLYSALMFDPLDIFEADEMGGLTLKHLEQIPPDLRRLITKLDVKSRIVNEETTQCNIKIEWVSKELVLQLVMRHLGMLKNDGPNVNVEVTVESTLVSQLRAALAAKSKVIDGNVIKQMASE